MATCICVAWAAAIGFEASWSLFAASGAVSRRSAALSGGRSSARPPRRATPPRDLVTKYCVTCHNERLKTANLSLDKADADHVSNSAETWEKVVVKLRSRAMPPPGSRRPDNATYDAVAAWLETELDRAARVPSESGPAGGSSSAQSHRICATPFATCWASRSTPTSMLPPDAQAYGFDTNADALSIEPALLDRYLTAAAKIARLAIGDPTLRPTFERYTAVKGNSNEQTWLWQTDRLGEDFPAGLAGRDRRTALFPRRR